MLSKTFQEPAVFPGFAHVAFQNVSKTRVCQGICACCVHVARQNVSRSRCFPRFLRMLRPCCCPKCFNNLMFCLAFFVLRPCCFPKCFNNLVLPQVFVHVALMFHPRWFPNGSNNPLFSQVIAHVGFMVRPCCFPKRFNNLVFLPVFARVVFMLRPCCFPKRFNILVFAKAFRAVCLHVASMLLSKPLTKKNLFCPCCACCVCCFQQRFASLVFSPFLALVACSCFPKTIQEPDAFRGLSACFSHVACMWPSKTLSLLLNQLNIPKKTYSYFFDLKL